MVFKLHRLKTKEKWIRKKKRKEKPGFCVFAGEDVEEQVDRLSSRRRSGPHPGSIQSKTYRKLNILCL